MITQIEQTGSERTEIFQIFSNDFRSEYYFHIPAFSCRILWNPMVGIFDLGKYTVK
jgi:hypothetical protein